MLLFMYVLYIISTVVDWLSYIISLTLLYLIISLLLDLNMALQVKACDSAVFPQSQLKLTPSNLLEIV